MALQKLVLKPGINKEGTNYSNEGGFYNCDKIRFRSGYAEKIGGWRNIGLYTYQGIARSIWAWVSLTSESLLGLGTTQKFYIEYGTKYYDITPIRTTKSLDAPYISTTAGTLATTVYCGTHGATIGSYVTLTKAYTTLSSTIDAANTTPITVASTTNFPSSGTILINNEQISYVGKSATQLGTTSVTRSVNSTTTAQQLSGSTVISLEAITVGGVNFAGEFKIVNIDSVGYFTIIAPSMPTTASGGSGVYAIFQLNASTGAFTATSGWGAGGWGINPWGSGVVTTTTTPIRLWSQTNYDQDLIFAPRFGSIYWWTKNTNSFPRAITLNAQANAQTTSTTAKAITTASWLNGATDITVADNTGINTGAVVADGVGIVAGTYVTTTYAGGLTVPLSQATVSVAATTTTSLLANTAVLPQTVSLTSVTDYPTQGVIQVGSEKISYNGIVGNTLTITARGYDGTTVALHGIGSAVTFYETINTTVYFSYAGYHIPVETLLVTTSSTNAFTIAFGATPYDPYNFSDVANFDPLLVRWSDQDNPYEWVPEPTNQSGEQRLANGSVIVAAANTRQEILIWTDTAIYSMQYLGPPYVFGINLLMDNLSIASQNAAITVNNVTYWMGVDRFYSYSGRVETLPCTLRQFVFSNINRAQLAQIVCGTNEGFNEIWWFYPSANSMANDSYVIYNHLEGTWYYGTMNRTAWLDTQLEQNPLGAFSTENTYLPAAITSTANEIILKDASSLPAAGTITIDSEQITYTSIIGNTLTGCIRGVNTTTPASHVAYSVVQFTTPNQLMFHELGWDDVSSGFNVPIEAYIESSDFDIGDGLNFGYVWRILPDLTFDGSSASTPRCLLTVKVRQNSGSPYTTGSTDSQTVERVATYPVESYTGQVYTRVRGRQMAFRMESTQLGVFWQMGLMRIDVRQDGRR